MANHVIRDRLWESNKLLRCSRQAALAYPWIYLVADDWGRFEYQPRRIWSKVFGARDDIPLEEVAAWLSEYEQIGLLQRYGDNQQHAAWTNFIGRPPAHRRKSDIPEPPQKKEVKRSGRPKATARQGQAIDKVDLSSTEADPLTVTEYRRSENGVSEYGRSEGSDDPGPKASACALVPAKAPPGTIAKLYVASFDATFGRRVTVTPDIPGKIKNLLTDGYQPWQVVAVPILVDANMDDPGFRKELQTEMLLRDGKHPRTVNGRTTGATHWLERELQRADRTVLDERLTEIAKQFGVLEPLMQLGVSLRRESGL